MRSSVTHWVYHVTFLFTFCLGFQLWFQRYRSSNNILGGGGGVGMLRLGVEDWTETSENLSFMKSVNLPLKSGFTDESGI